MKTNTREIYTVESKGLKAAYPNHPACLVMLGLNVSINVKYNKNE